MRDTGGKLAQRSEIFLELHLLLQGRKFRQVAQQANRSIDLFLPLPNRRDGDSQVATLAGRSRMLYFLTTKNRAVAQALRNQSRQRGGFAEGLAVAPEAQTANTQNLLRSGIRAGNNPGGVNDQQARRHIARDFFAETLGMSGALLFDAMQPLH